MGNIYSLILSLILINLSGCAVNPATGEQDLVLMSEQSEIALGRKTNKKVLQQYIVYDDPGLQAYVNDVGQALAEQSPLEQYQEEKLRLLNGLYPQGKASSKPLLKIIN